MFADDINLHMSASNVRTLQRKVKAEIQNIDYWIRANKLSINYNQGRSQTFSFGGATGGASFATRGAVNGLCRTSMQWHDVTRKILGGTLEGPGKILGGQWLPMEPP